MKLFPLKFAMMKTGCWHWVSDSGHTRCQQSWYFNKTDDSDRETAELSLEEWKKMGNRPRINNESICNACLPLLNYAISGHINKEDPMEKLDLSKPVILCSDGSSHQAESKTIKDAKDLAKKLIDADLRLSASIFVPHTNLKHKPAIQITRCKACS